MRWQLLIFNLILILVAVQPEAFGQRLTEGPKPVKADLAGFGEVNCSSLPSRTRICEVSRSESDIAKYIVQVNAKTVRSIETPSLWSMPGNGFATYRGDLDKDGVPELILVTFDGISNGMSVSHSTVYIFQDPTRFPDAAPVSFQIRDFGGNESFVFDKKLQRTLLLVTYWNRYETLDKKRGEGMYLIGKWFAYQKGKLKPVLDRPTLARRYLSRFQDERLSDEKDRRPYQWLQDRTTHRFFREPLAGTRVESTTLGTISSFTITDENGCEIEIKTANGKTVEANCAKEGFPVRDEDTPISIGDIGILKNRYIFPYDFDPSLSYGKLTGMRVKLENKTDADGNKYSDLWFVDE